MKKLLSLILIATISLSTLFVGSVGVGAVKKPKAPKNVKVTNQYYFIKKIAVELNTVKNKAIKGYEVTGTAKGVKKLKADAPQYYYLSKTNADLEKVKNNVFYKIRARAYIKKNGKKIYSKYSKATYACNAVVLKDFSISNQLLKWGKVNGAQKYDVYASFTKNSDKYTKISTTKNTSYKITKIGNKQIRKGMSFYVKIIAKKKVGNKIYSSDNSLPSYCYVPMYV